MFKGTDPQTGATRDFYHLDDFLEFRECGWTAGAEIDAQVDEKRKQLEETPEHVLNWMAPMQMGRAERYEAVRRLKAEDAAEEQETA